VDWVTNNLQTVDQIFRVISNFEKAKPEVINKCVYLNSVFAESRVYNNALKTYGFALVEKIFRCRYLQRIQLISKNLISDVSAIERAEKSRRSKVASICVFPGLKQEDQPVISVEVNGEEIDSVSLDIEVLDEFCGLLKERQIGVADQILSYSKSVLVDDIAFEKIYLTTPEMKSKIEYLLTKKKDLEIMLADVTKSREGAEPNPLEDHLQRLYFANLYLKTKLQEVDHSHGGSNRELLEKIKALEAEKQSMKNEYEHKLMELEERIQRTTEENSALKHEIQEHETANNDFNSLLASSNLNFDFENSEDFSVAKKIIAPKQLEQSLNRIQEENSKMQGKIQELETANKELTGVVSELQIERKTFLDRQEENQRKLGSLEVRLEKNPEWISTERGK